MRTIEEIQEFVLKLTKKEMYKDTLGILLFKLVLVLNVQRKTV